MVVDLILFSDLQSVVEVLVNVGCVANKGGGLGSGWEEVECCWSVRVEESVFIVSLALSFIIFTLVLLGPEPSGSSPELRFLDPFSVDPFTDARLGIRAKSGGVEVLAFRTETALLICSWIFRLDIASEPPEHDVIKLEGAGGSPGILCRDGLSKP